MDIPILSEIKKVKDVCSVAKKAQDLNEDIRNYKNYSEIVNEVNTTFTQSLSVQIINLIVSKKIYKKCSILLVLVMMQDFSLF